jgi:hypothetical protein
MSLEIRQIEEFDYRELPQLFNHRKSHEFISWLYSHPNHHYKSAYVAIESNELIGAIGYIKQPYFVDGELLNGLIPLSWEVKQEKRGLAGLKLLFKALNDSDFYLGLDGSEDMKGIFKQLGFKKVGEARGAQKVLKPFRYLRTLKSIGVKDLLRYTRDLTNYLLIGHESLPLTVLKSIDIQMYEGATSRKDTFSNSISKGHLEWLNRMPGIKLHLFNIVTDEVCLSPVVIMIKNFKTGLNNASILHIPPMEVSQLSLLKDVIVDIERFLKAQHVTSVKILSSDKLLDKVLKKRGFVIENKVRPIVVKGRADLIDRIQKQNIYVTYIESDKSVRNI